MMSRYREAFIKSIPALVGLCIIIFFGSVLAGSVYHSALTKYGQPICSIDRHRFESETCEACGNSIMRAGVFFSTNVALESPYSSDYQVSFKDYYESYEAFKADYDMCLTYSGVVLVTVVAEVCFYVFLLMSSKKGKTAPRLGGKKK